jgi:hypothetical protein
LRQENFSLADFSESRSLRLYLGQPAQHNDSSFMEERTMIWYTPLKASRSVARPVAPRHTKDDNSVRAALKPVGSDGHGGTAGASTRGTQSLSGKAPPRFAMSRRPSYDCDHRIDLDAAATAFVEHPWRS